MGGFKSANRRDFLQRGMATCALAGLPLIGRSEAHADEPWVKRLSRPDHVLLMRHALAPGIGDPADFKHGKCHTQRNLNEQGRVQAKHIGAWLKSRGLDQAQVFTSPWCRCVDTAQGLGLGPVMVEPSLGSFFGNPEQQARQTRDLSAFVTKALSRKGSLPLVLVSHHVNIEAYTGQVLDSGEMIVVQVDSTGRSVAHERIYGL